MRIELQTLLTIFGMALVTYLTRVGGLWLMNRVTLSGRVERGLSNLPGAVMISIVAPALLSSGWIGLVAGLLTALVARRTGNLLLAMLTGVGCVLIYRLLTNP